MKEQIRHRALELGFDDCRFTTARPPESGDKFSQWLATGRQGEMGYLARNSDKRIDPQRVLPGVRSVICLAVSYRREESAGSGGNGGEVPPTSASHVPHRGVIARYARFRDYHEILAERLKELAAQVNALGGPATNSLWYVDTGPVLERDLAQRAGLGFIGKHTNLISRRLGNWFFLGEILTNLELPADLPARNHCGSCSRCLTACPTRAITAAFQMDARRCISYLTIELKGPIPVELRPLVGNRIFGCDDCLAACPWNRFAQEGSLMKQHARDDLATPDLIALLQLDEVDFKRCFAGTPLQRAKRRGLLRNVCVALGNSGAVNALQTLNLAAKDADPLIAEHARWAVERIENAAFPSSTERNLENKTGAS